MRFLSNVDDVQLRQDIKNSVFSRVYFVYGGEDYVKRTSVDLLVKSFTGGDTESFDFKRLSGDTTSVDDVFDATQTMPLMSKYVCALVCDFPFESLDDGDFEALKQIISDVPDTSVLIFWQLAEPKGKTNKQNAVINLVKKVGCAVECSLKTGASLQKTVGAGIRKRGCSISERSLRYLIDTVGSDLYLLLNEVEKLTAYRPGGEITNGDIDKLCTRSLELDAFDVTRAVISGNCDAAFSALRELFILREEPIRILGAIIAAYVDMYRVKVALARDGVYNALTDAFSCYKKDFRLKKAAVNASKVSLEDLRKALEVLDRADELMKSTGADEKRVLEELIVRLVMI